MELPIGDRVYAAERIMKKRVRRVSSSGRGYQVASVYIINKSIFDSCYRHSTWEPEENILDGRLIDSFEQSQRGEFHHGRRGGGKKKESSRYSTRSAPIPEVTPPPPAEEEPGELEDHVEEEVGKLTEGEESQEGEDSQDEEPVAQLPELELAESKDREEPVTVRAPQKMLLQPCSWPADPENSNSSSGEDHQPVLAARREPAGTKRKAEVLSKESGKIGVTITTSSPPPNKVPKLSTSSGKPSPPYSPQPVPIRRASSSSTKSNPETSRAKEDPTSRPPTVIGSKSREDLSQAYNRGPKSPATFSLTPTLPGGGDKRPITVALTPASGHSQQEQVTSLATSAPKEELSKLKRSLSEGSAVVQRETLSAAMVLPIQANQDSADKNLSSSSNAAPTNTNIQCGNNMAVRPVHCDILDRQTHFLPHRVIKHPREVYRNPGAAYWLKRAPVADKVFITDVTVNLKTVTIRECKTEKGFFREREDSKQSDVL
ncbi:unnamed protein product [Timema podura]|uniref:Chromo domain-containing protein n=1 Tax=Timema podura TaxID=61482 RepID=A0ABN7NLH2_TIMPD|nr:unnamed protein product [Timema podura]